MRRGIYTKGNAEVRCSVHYRQLLIKGVARASSKQTLVIVLRELLEISPRSGSGVR